MLSQNIIFESCTLETYKYISNDSGYSGIDSWYLTLIPDPKFGAESKKDLKNYESKPVFEKKKNSLIFHYKKINF